MLIFFYSGHVCSCSCDCQRRIARRQKNSSSKNCFRNFGQQPVPDRQECVRHGADRQHRGHRGHRYQAVRGLEADADRVQARADGF